MRALLPALILSLAAPALAQPGKPRAAAAHSVGTFGQWQAATHTEAGATTCFAFTRAEAGGPHIVGRGDVILSVTRRPGSHDVVAVTAGFVLAGHEDAALQAGAAHLLFYIANRSAFAHDNAAAITTFGQESSVTAHLPGPRGAITADHFSLKGFASALAAMQKACPA